MNRRLGITVSAITIVAVAGCSSTANTPSSSGTPGGTAGGSAPASAQPFGTDCPPNVAGMARESLASAAADNPALAGLLAALGAAGLTDLLNQPQDVTVFAPNSGAFAKIPAGTLAKIITNKDELKKIIQYHLVTGKLAPDQLPGTHTTQEGQSITITGSGTDFTVNGTAKIVCGNIQTINASIYIIDGVLMP